MFAASKTASVSGGYQISRSLRFNSADSAYLNRTPASAGNRKTWTWSGWVKRSTLNASSSQALLDVQLDANSNFTLTLRNDTLAYDLQYISYLNRIILGTSAVYRDVSAWYHVVLSVDTTNATAANRIRAYINGSEVSLNQYFLGSGYVAQNTDLAVNSTAIHSMGRRNDATPDLYLPAYMTEVNFIDGQALTPSSFGETNAQTGVWQPKAYSGSYGTNGFYLNFSDNSNTTAATLGKDYSGNGNNWTPNNFSVTAGAGNDSLVDSPTSYGTDTGVGGTVRGNYATLNPLKKKSAATISNGNLALVATSAVYVTGLSTISPSSGTYYMEMVCSGSNSNRPWAIGMVETTASADASMSSTGTYFVTNNSGSTVNYYVAGSPTALSTSSTWVAGDIISLAWNVDSGKFWVGRNGVWYPSSTGGTVASNSDVAAGNYPTFTISYSGNTNPQVIPAFVTYDTTASIDANFGQRPFAYTAPSGFKALCTQNLPTPTIGATTATQASQYFTPTLFTGTGAAGNAVTVGFQPDFTWVKDRVQTGGYHHILQDAVRGANKVLYSNLTNAEVTASGFSFTSTGFTVGTGIGDINVSGSAEVAWNWKANGSGSTNTAGSITSTVSANTTSGFSVVTYTGNGSTGATIGHGLGAAPKMVIVKNRGAVTDWIVGHTSIGWANFLKLNSTDASASFNVWNSTAPTSTVVTLGSDGAVNGSSMVAYCFAEVAGYSKFTSWTGNGSADGPFIFTGFRPAYVMVKLTSAAGEGWWVFDNKRNAYNVTNSILSPNSSGAEITGDYGIDMVSNGFKIRNSQGFINSSGATYICAAFAESPFKYSLAR